MTTMRSTDYSVAVIHTATGLFWRLATWGVILAVIWGVIVLVMTYPVLLVLVALGLVGFRRWEIAKRNESYQRAAERSARRQS